MPDQGTMHGRQSSVGDAPLHGAYEQEAVLDRMAEWLRACPEIPDDRRETVEHPFGSIKHWMGQGAFLMKRLDNVRAEFSLTALAYNLRQAIIPPADDD